MNELETCMNLGDLLIKDSNAKF